MRRKGRKDRPRVWRTWWWEKGIRFWGTREWVLFARVNPLGKPVGPGRVVPGVLASPSDAWLLCERVVCDMLKKPDSPAPGTGALATVIDVKFKGLYPVLWDYLTQSTWDDGSPRETSGLTVFTQDGMVKVLLKDNDRGMCLWAAGTGVFDALAALEKALGSPAADWRIDRRKGGGVAKKR